MCKEYRYAKKNRRERDFNLHVREMVEVLSNEKQAKQLYLPAIKLSNHAKKRVRQNFKIENEATAKRYIKDLLKQAKKIGQIMSYDGRVNILYATNGIAIYMSPCLKNVTTINKYNEYKYNNIDKALKKKSREQLIAEYEEKLSELEAEEKELTSVVLSINERIKHANENLRDILFNGKNNSKRRKTLKGLIASQNYELKVKARILFGIHVEKRIVAKSLVLLSKDGAEDDKKRKATRNG